MPLETLGLVVYLYDLQLERLRGVVVLQREVELPLLLRGVAVVGVHVHQRDAAVLEEGELQEKEGERMSHFAEKRQDCADKQCKYDPSTCLQSI